MSITSLSFRVDRALLRYAPLVIIILLGFSLVAPPFFNNSFQNPKPNSLLAGDAYGHLFYIESILRDGNYRSEPQETLMFTGQSSATPAEPPLQFYYSAFLANLLEIPAHTAALLGLLLAVTAAFCTVYAMLAKYDYKLAVLSSPFFLFLFSYPFVAGITWGFWKAYFSYALLFISFAYFPAELKKRHTLPLALLISSVFIAHPTMGAYALFFLAIKAGLDGLRRHAHIVFLILAISAALSLNYLLDSSIRVEGGLSVADKVLKLAGYDPGYDLGGATPLYSNFGFLWYLAAAGFFYSAYLIFASGAEKQRKIFVLFSLLFLVFLLSNAGFGRVYQFRLVWPLVVSVFIGLALYAPLDRIASLKAGALPSILLFFASLLLLFYSGFLNPPQGDFSILSGELWSAYRYIAADTPQTAKVLIIDPALTQPMVVLHTMRYTRYLDSASFLEMARGNTPVSEKETKVMCLMNPNFGGTRKGFRIIPGNVTIETACRDKKTKTCEFDYIVVNKMVKSNEEAGLLNGFLSEISRANYDVLENGQQALLLKNREVCTNGQ